MKTPAELAALHFERYGLPAQVFSAPGRVNLIGEHTDYCDGFVMPAAIDFSTLVAIRRAQTGVARCIRSISTSRSSHPLEHVSGVADSELRAGATTHWADYPAGVLWALREHGIASRRWLFDDDRGRCSALGAGLEFLRSIEVATAFAVLGRHQLRDAAAQDCSQLLPACRERVRRRERRHHGPVRLLLRRAGPCGDDRLPRRSSTRSRRFRRRPHRDLQLHGEARELAAAGTTRAARRSKQGIADPAQHRPEIKALRDATVDDLAQWGGEMPPNVLRRCRHVITEDNRVLAAVEAFQRQRPAALRRTDARGPRQLPRRLRGFVPGDRYPGRRSRTEQPGCFGARLTGGGFGGCTVNLVAAEQVAAFVEAMRAGYLCGDRHRAEIYTSRPPRGRMRSPGLAGF